MSDTPAHTVLLYGGHRTLRLDVARLLREDGVRVLLASAPAEAAKALAGGGVRVIAALSPLSWTPDSPVADGAALVHAVDANVGEAGHERGETDALAWRERIRQKLMEPSDQPTSSA